MQPHSSFPASWATCIIHVSCMQLWRPRPGRLQVYKWRVETQRGNTDHMHVWPSCSVGQSQVYQMISCVDACLWTFDLSTWICRSSSFYLLGTAPMCLPSLTGPHPTMQDWRLPSVYLTPPCSLVPMLGYLTQLFMTMPPEVPLCRCWAIPIPFCISAIRYWRQWRPRNNHAIKSTNNLWHAQPS